MKAFRVECCENGDLYKVQMEKDDFNVNSFKKVLSTFSGIPIGDQILLIGPPFKSLDPFFGSDMQIDPATKIFLYNRCSLSGHSDNTIPLISLRPNAPPEVEPLGGKTLIETFI